MTDLILTPSAAPVDVDLSTARGPAKQTAHKETIKDLDKMVKNWAKMLDAPAIIVAYKLSKLFHKDQLRTDGDPYITHPVGVAELAYQAGTLSGRKHSELILDLIVALLHDGPEDSLKNLAIKRNPYSLIDNALKDFLTVKERKEIQNCVKSLNKNEEEHDIKLLSGRSLSTKILDRTQNTLTMTYKQLGKAHKKTKELVFFIKKFTKETPRTTWSLTIINIGKSAIFDIAQSKQFINFHNTNMHSEKLLRQVRRIERTIVLPKQKLGLRP